MAGYPPSDEFMEVLGLLQTGGPTDFEFVKSLVEQFPDGVDAWLGRHWIRTAVECGSLEVVKWMLQQGVNLKFKDRDGYTILHSAIDNGGAESIEKIRMLIAAGADLNAHGIEDWTPLHMAVARGRLDLVEILLEAGADRSIRTRIDSYQTPEEMAGRAGAELIRNFRRRPANWRPVHRRKID